MYQQTPFPQWQPPNQPYDRAQLRKRTRSCLWIGCVHVPLLIALIVGSPIAISMYINQHLYQSQATLNGIQTLALIIGGGVALCLLAFVIAAVFRRFNGLSLVMLLLSFWGAAIIIGILLPTSALASHIGLTRTGFLLTSATTDGNGAVTFYNPPDGITQVLCLGVDGHCRPLKDHEPTTPSLTQLAHGIVIHPGQVVRIAFFNSFEGAEDTYLITSETVPHMNVAVDASNHGD